MATITSAWACGVAWIITSLAMVSGSEPQSLIAYTEAIEGRWSDLPALTKIVFLSPDTGLIRGALVAAEVPEIAKEASGNRYFVSSIFRAGAEAKEGAYICEVDPETLTIAGDYRHGRPFLRHHAIGADEKTNGLMVAAPGILWLVTTDSLAADGKQYVDCVDWKKKALISTYEIPDKMKHNVAISRLGKQCLVHFWGDLDKTTDHVVLLDEKGAVGNLKDLGLQGGERIAHFCAGDHKAIAGVTREANFVYCENVTDEKATNLQMKTLPLGKHVDDLHSVSAVFLDEDRKIAYIAINNSRDNDIDKVLLLDLKTFAVSSVVEFRDGVDFIAQTTGSQSPFSGITLKTSLIHQYDAKLKVTSSKPLVRTMADVVESH